VRKEKIIDEALLRTLIETSSVSGCEERLAAWISDYCSKKLTNRPDAAIFSGQGWQNNVLVVLGKPKRAFYAHLDTHGFRVRYGNEVVLVGSPSFQSPLPLAIEEEDALSNQANQRNVLVSKEGGHLTAEQPSLKPGVMLRFMPNLSVGRKYISGSYLDNRLGILAALHLLDQLDIQDIAIAFTCNEEAYAGSAGFLAKELYERYECREAIICDVTMASEGVKPGDGFVVSHQDMSNPRRAYVLWVEEQLNKAGIRFQREVETHGGSDGSYIAKTPYPIDWCFVGPPIKGMHSPNEQSVIQDVLEWFGALAHLAREPISGI